MQRLFGFIVMALTVITMNAADFVAIAKDGNIYDEASAKYITVNQQNEDISVIPGMVFPTNEHTPGWYKIEYVPGVHAFIPEQIVAGSFNEPMAGSYTIVNNPGQKLNVEGSADNWNATANGQTYKGQRSQNILVFLDNQGNIAYSLVDLGNGPIAITYDDKITKFF